MLLCDAWGLPKEKLLARMGEEVPAPVVEQFARRVELRVSGWPVSYIRNLKEFYGREFLVDERVLIPRPETELLVETALELVRDAAEPVRVHDCCTGSGCVAITIAAESPRVRVTASDISNDALAVARVNAERHLGQSEEIGFFQSDMLATPTGLLPRPHSRPSIVVANPPYLTTSEYERLRRAGWPEPALALESGERGLDHLQKLVIQAGSVVEPDGWLVTEIGSGQGNEALHLFLTAGFTDCRVIADLAGHNRICMGKRPEE